MLEQVDLDKKLSKEEFKERMPALELKLMELQQRLKAEALPLIVVFEGWDAAGKGTAIERLVERLDPRGFKVHRVHDPTPEEQHRPFLWRFWTKTPARGRMAIFDRSWYTRVLDERVEKTIKKAQVQEAFGEIRNFERQLADDGAVLVKFWLHISKKEQKKRFKEIESDKYLAWKVGAKDWERHERYDDYAEAVEELLAKTSTAHTPWTVVEATNDRHAHVKIFTTVIEAVLQGLDRKRKRQAAQAVATTDTEPITRHSSPTILDRVDLTLKLDKDSYELQLKKYQSRLRELEFEIYRRRIPVVVAYEGWDAAGKGGNIKRLTAHLDPRGYEVTSIAAPTTEEKQHHHLWRFWNQIPKAGHLAIYDRTWYGRVLVERIEGFCTEDDWRRAYQELNEFEEHLANYGTVLCKFWLHISKAEQLRRFEERQAIEHKRWKITEEDWRNREKWDRYEEAVIDMLERTSTSYAPWTIVEGEDKSWARIRTLRTVCEAIERRLAR